MYFSGPRADHESTEIHDAALGLIMTVLKSMMQVGCPFHHEKHHMMIIISKVGLSLL